MFDAIVTQGAIGVLKPDRQPAYPVPSRYSVRAYEGLEYRTGETLRRPVQSLIVADHHRLDMAAGVPEKSDRFVPFESEEGGL